MSIKSFRLFSLSFSAKYIYKFVNPTFPTYA
nr:MAG TPA: hypothetical protein [Caudoviricetes sp.]